jgi:leader peptidase (prepilin peptidase) / N-methyltransferase
MLAFIFISFFWFILGAAVGSFLNVLVFRSVRSRDWVRGRSVCDFCQKPLTWYDNIPLLSFLFLRGHSRCCQQKLSLAHPVVEFLTGIMFVWWYWGGSLFFKLTTQPLVTLQPLFWLLVGIMLLGILVADALYMIIPDILVISLALLVLVYRLTLLSLGIMRGADFLAMLAGMLLVTGFFVALFLFTKGKGFGLGDVKFALPMSLLLGWPNILVGIFIAFILGSIVGLILLFSQKRKLKQAIPFAPFLVTGTIMALLFGDSLLHWYLAML